MKRAFVFTTNALIYDKRSNSTGSGGKAESLGGEASSSGVDIGMR